MRDLHLDCIQAYFADDPGDFAVIKPDRPVGLGVLENLRN